MQHADYMSRIESVETYNQAYEPIFVLNILYNDQGIYMSQRSNIAKVMASLMQTSEEKVDLGKTSRQAVIRETLEETGIKCNLEYWGTDYNYDCDMYTYRLGKDEKP